LLFSVQETGIKRSFLIRGRLEAAGGALDIMSAPRQGTRLRAVIPLEI
jgi:signal transduction histidine kinase